MTYTEFLNAKAQLEEGTGFEPVWHNEKLYPFQSSLVEWALRRGRSALFEDCGMGKTAQLVTWAENVRRKTDGRVLILTPLSVAIQTQREAEKFGVDAQVSRDGKLKGQITIANYEKLHLFNCADFAGVVCDESGILKNFDGVTRDAVVEFMRRVQYRLLCTATAAPNDYPELGNSSEALGYMGYMDMLSKFFKNDQSSNHPNRLWSGDGKWRFRGHAERDFWRWVCSWARSLRKPSDLGFDDAGFVLPPLNVRQHVMQCEYKPEGFLISVPAHTNDEKRKERRGTLEERCATAATLAKHDRPVIAWCNLNDEGDALERALPDSQQITGARSQSDDEKEEIITNFIDGKTRVLVAKPSSCGFGLNLQHCAHQTFFPSHSFEQYYQAVRRSWRFGQKSAVQVDVITSEGESRVLASLQRKAQAAEQMFSRLVALMNDELSLKRKNPFKTKQKAPSWLSSTK